MARNPYLNRSMIRAVDQFFGRQREVERIMSRLAVLEAQGRLLVFDAVSDDVSTRYITKWGRFGSAPGEFQISPPTSVAMVVDSMGRIYVADGEKRIQVFIP